MLVIHHNTASSYVCAVLVVVSLRIYGTCWVPVRLETAPTGVVE